MQGSGISVRILVYFRIMYLDYFPILRVSSNDWNITYRVVQTVKNTDIECQHLKQVPSSWDLVKMCETAPTLYSFS